MIKSRKRNIWRSSSAMAGIALAAIAGSATGALAETHALLVGVTEYPNLDERLWLNGPMNDVALVESVLLEQGLSDEQITVLSEAEDADGQPTRAAILGELDRLIAEVAPGDFVYLHMGGHGSQQPAMDENDESELDGLDEIFLPRDVGAWDGQVGSVENAIVDNDLQPRMEALRDAGAFVFAVFDSCHSGTMVRAIDTEEVDRRLDPTLLGIPDAALAEAAADAPATRGGPASEEGVLDLHESDSDGPGGFVAFYAAQTTETTPEMRLPAGDPNRQTYGLFSYTIATILASNPGITYRQATQQILAEYAGGNRRAPTPLFEGTAADMDRIMMGGAPSDTVRQWPVTEDRGTYRLPAGQLHQVSDGAIMAVMESATAPSGAQPLGYAAVYSAQVVHSFVEPIAYDGAAVLDEIPEGAFLRLVDAQFTVSLTVALPEETTAAAIAEAPAHAEIERLLTDGLPGLDVRWVDAHQTADLRLVIVDGKLWFAPPSGAIVTEGPARTPALTIPDATDQVGMAEFRVALEENIEKVARVSTLFRLSAELAATEVGRGLDLSFEVERADGSGVERFTLTDFPTLHDGDELRFFVTNNSEQVMDLTALFIDAKFAVIPWFPYQGESNRMGPGETLESSLIVNLETVGVEQFLFVAAAVQPQAPRADFSFLAQTGLATRSIFAPSAVENASTVLDVMREAGLEEVATRGGGRGGGATALATMSAFSWTVSE